ncbi:MAG: tetratricopeptide repeat protein, partial [Campylobacterota bacterium]|nr:tetratricopeptide repeat protein [Campylobacterota bacterium]
MNYRSTQMRRWLSILFVVSLWATLLGADSASKKNLYRKSQKFNSEGYRLYHKGDYASAKKKFQKYISIEEKRLDKNDPDLGSVYNNIANVYSNMLDYGTAVEYYQKSIDFHEKFSGKMALGASASYSGLADLYSKLKEHKKAIYYLEKSILLTQKDKKNQHVLPHNYNQIASLYTVTNNLPKALEYSKKSLELFQKSYGRYHSQTAKAYNQIGNLYYRMGDHQKTSEYYEKASAINEKLLKDTSRGKENFLIALEYAKMANFYSDINDLNRSLIYREKELSIYEKYGDKKGVFIPTTYNNIASLYYSMGEYNNSLKYLKKALKIKEKGFGKRNPETVKLYSNIAYLYRTLGDDQKSLSYHKKALKGCGEGCGKEHPNNASIYNDLSLLYINMTNYSEAYHYALLSFDNLLANRDQIFSILDVKGKEKYLKDNIIQVALLMYTTTYYLIELNQKQSTQKFTETLQTSINAWLNYKGSIFDSENSIATLYASTKDKKLKTKIDDLVSHKRELAKLYQSLPKPKEREEWQKSIKEIEEKISKLTHDISSKNSIFKEQQGLESIDCREIASRLKENELYIDYAKVGDVYYLFTLDHKESITFTFSDANSTKKINTLVKSFREDITAIINDTNISDKELKTLTESSKEKLSQLYDLVIKRLLGDTIKDKRSLIISPDGALRLLPFETLYNKENNQYFIEEKEIRYIPSGKELVRLYRYSKEKKSKREKST